MPQVHIKRISHPTTGVETGAVLIAQINSPTNAFQKATIENQLVRYAFDHLYPGEGLNLYREIHVDTPSIVVIKKINELPDQVITI